MTVRLVALATAVLLFRSASAGAATAEYVHVVANDGEAAGGHVALRLDDQVYHFQHGARGLLRLARASWDAFRYHYAVRENRSLRVATFALDDDAFERLRRGLNERYLAERRQDAVARSLADDRRLLERLGAAERIRLPGALRAAGFFFDAEGASRGPGAATIERVAAAIADVHGARYLDTRIDALDASLRDLRPAARDATDLDRADAVGPGFAERWAALGLERLALAVLARPAALRPGSVVIGDDLPPLSSVERDKLGAFADELASTLAALVDSLRADRGFPLTVGLARLAAIEQAIAADRLIVLDAFPPDATTVPPPSTEAGARLLAALATDARRRLAETRERVFAAPRLHERDLAALEEAVGRYEEVRRGCDGHPLRIATAPFLPSRTADVPLLAPALAPRDVERARVTAGEAAATWTDALARRYAYRLIDRNCASELLASIDEVLAPAPHAGARAATLGFVPFGSYDAVRATYPIAAEREIPSLRRALLARMAATEPALRVWARESNTLTSTVYQRSERDAFFLFFTDDSIAVRPLLGAANVLAGVAWTIAGLVESPLDRGRTLRAGAEGVLFSLPELAFVNFRKGRMGATPDAVARLEVGATANPAGK